MKRVYNNSRTVGWTDVGYTEAEFVEVVMSLEGFFVARSRNLRGLDGSPVRGDEAMLDFVSLMFDRGWWKDWDPRRGNLAQFVTRYATIYLTGLHARSARNLVRRRRIEKTAHDRGRIVARYNPRLHDGAKELVGKIIRRTSAAHVAVIDAVLATAGDIPMAAQRLGVDPKEVRKALRSVRNDSLGTGLCPRLIEH